LSSARSSAIRGRSSSRISSIAQHFARQRIEPRERLDLVVEQLDAHRLALGFRREDVDDVAPHPVRALRQVELVARVLHVGEAAQQLALVEPVAAHQVQHHAEVRLRVAEAVNCGHRRHDDRVRPLEQRLGGRQPHLLDVRVHRRVLLDVGVGRRDVCLRLVVVVVADEVLDRVLREVLLELAVQLRGQRLVVRHHQRGALHALDDVRDREGLARARDAEERLVRQAVLEPLDQLLDRLRLVARRLVVRLQLEGFGSVGHRTDFNRAWGTLQITLKCRHSLPCGITPRASGPFRAPQACQALSHRRFDRPRRGAEG
jgi:hypothetical protein